MLKKGITFAVLLLLTTACTEVIKSEIKPGNEEFFLQGDSDRGVLLIHGFTASPHEVRELAEYLNDNGLTVYAPLLSGHGEQDYRALGTVSWEDWVADSYRAYNHLKESADTLFVGGVSLGAELALEISKQEDTQGVIVISSSLIPKNQLFDFAPILKYVVPYSTNAKLSESDEQYYYKKRPVSAIAELALFNKYFEKDLDKVSEPLLILQSNNDYMVDPKSASVIEHGVGSASRKLIYYDVDSHILLTSEKKDQVYKEILDFINSNSD